MEEKGKKTDKIKDELNKLMLDFHSTFKTNTEDTESEDKSFGAQVKEFRNDSMIKFNELNPQFKKQASDAIDAMYKFYVDMSILDKNEYLKKKKELLSLNLYGIFFQLNTVKTVIEKVAEEITSGDLTPKLIDSFGLLNEKFMEIIKSNANYLLFVEDVVKNTVQGAVDRGELPTETVKEAEKQSKYYVTSNQKKLIDDLDRNVIEPNSDNVSYELVNPRSKSEIMEKMGINESLIKDKDDLENINYGDILNIM